MSLKSTKAHWPNFLTTLDFFGLTKNHEITTKRIKVNKSSLTNLKTNGHSHPGIQTEKKVRKRKRKKGGKKKRKKTTHWTVAFLHFRFIIWKFDFERHRKKTQKQQQKMGKKWKKRRQKKGRKKRKTKRHRTATSLRCNFQTYHLEIWLRAPCWPCAGWPATPGSRAGRRGWAGARGWPTAGPCADTATCSRWCPRQTRTWQQQGGGYLGVLRPVNREGSYQGDAKMYSYRQVQILIHYLLHTPPLKIVCFIA